MKGYSKNWSLFPKNFEPDLEKRPRADRAGRSRSNSDENERYTGGSRPSARPVADGPGDFTDIAADGLAEMRAECSQMPIDIIGDLATLWCNVQEKDFSLTVARPTVYLAS